MSSFVKIVRTLVLPLALASFLGACATNRSVIDVEASVGPTVSGLAAAPAGYAKITEIRDARKFEVNPSDPSLPSLGDAQEIQDPKITSRAVGRKRNTFGQALGDVVLPEGKSVADLVRTSLKSALQQKGYAVVEPGAPEYARALPVSAEVTQFWAWLSPGFWALPFRCDWGVTLTAPEIVGPTPVALSGRADHSTQAGFDSEWQKTLNLGVADMTAKLRDQIKAPAARPGGVPTS